MLLPAEKHYNKVWAVAKQLQKTKQNKSMTLLEKHFVVFWEVLSAAPKSQFDCRPGTHVLYTNFLFTKSKKSLAYIV